MLLEQNIPCCIPYDYKLFNFGWDPQLPQATVKQSFIVVLGWTLRMKWGCDTKFYIASAAPLSRLLKGEKQSSVGQGASTTPSSTVQWDEMPSKVTPTIPPRSSSGWNKRYYFPTKISRGSKIFTHPGLILKHIGKTNTDRNYKMTPKSEWKVWTSL